jgi:hypothetical protein
MDGNHAFFSKGTTSASAPGIDLVGGHPMEKWVRRAIPLQRASKQRENSEMVRIADQDRSAERKQMT